MIATLPVEETIACKYCGLTAVSKCGSYNHVQRYLCKSCGKKFKVDENLFYMRVPAGIVAECLKGYYQGRRIGGIRNHLVRESGVRISRTVIYQWLSKFTDHSINFFSNYSPVRVGDTWIVGETIIKAGNQKFLVYDIIDAKTLFIISTTITTNRSVPMIRTIMQKARQITGVSPRLVMTHMPYSCFNKLKKAFGCEAEHMHNQPPASNYNIELIENFAGIFKTRYKTIARVKTLSSVRHLVEGWNIDYNYFRSQGKLGNRTPAETAGIEYYTRSWYDLILSYNKCNQA
jgi:transposase-like protein